MMGTRAVWQVDPFGRHLCLVKPRAKTVTARTQPGRLVFLTDSVGWTAGKKIALLFRFKGPGKIHDIAAQRPFRPYFLSLVRHCIPMNPNRKSICGI